MKNLIITQEVWKEGNMYTSYCPELDVASCGRTIEETQKNLIEALGFLHHKHTQKGIIQVTPPSLEDVLAEILHLLS